jgi:hypothetical protein
MRTIIYRESLLAQLKALLAHLDERYWRYCVTQNKKKIKK